MFDTSGHSYDREIIMLKVRWYLSYKLSYSNLAEMAAERGFEVDPSTICRWVLKFSPDIENAVRKHRKPVGKSWKLDETYIKIKGKWRYLYRAVDSDGDTVDYLLTTRRNTKAAKRFLNKAVKSSGEPDIVTMDKSGANKAAVDSYNKQNKTDVKIRQNKYLNNMIEQDHRPTKQLCRATLGFQSVKTAKITIGGFEAMRMLKKGQVDAGGKTPAENFYALCG